MTLIADISSLCGWIVFRFYSQQMAVAASGAVTTDMANYATVLDDFNSDLNLKIDPDG